mmetsp:Transcript_27092/g.72214  ORF Transcript_27092/g.72214 Transcript_27092/m.72214 type:complete len:208 (+) Transcript_27092:376-999(+)
MWTFSWQPQCLPIALNSASKSGLPNATGTSGSAGAAPPPGLAALSAPPSLPRLAAERRALEAHESARKRLRLRRRPSAQSCEGAARIRWAGALFALEGVANGGERCGGWASAWPFGAEVSDVCWESARGLASSGGGAERPGDLALGMASGGRSSAAGSGAPASPSSWLAVVRSLSHMTSSSDLLTQHQGSCGAMSTRWASNSSLKAA